MEKLLDLVKQKALIAKSTTSCREFINSFADANSFVEMDAFLFTQNSYIGEKSIGEGVVTGFVTIDNNPCYVYCQNYDVLKGGLGKAHAEKILKCMRMASKTGAPIISILNTAGARMGEGVTALDGYAEIIAESVKLSGIVPQIAIIKGDCFGTMSYLASLNDFVFMMKDSSLLSSAPLVISANSNVTKTAVEIGGSDMHIRKGLCSFSCKTTNDLSKGLKKLLSLIPPTGESQVDCNDDLNRVVALNAKSDAKKIVSEVLDKESFLQIGDEEGKVVFGLGRLAGITVGVVATGDKNGAIALCPGCSKKIARFVRMLDCFNVPLLNFVNCSGSVQSIDAEERGLVSSIGALMYAISEAGIPKISVVQTAIGIGYTALASKAIGFDYALAWDSALISTIPANVGVELVYSDELIKSGNSEKVRAELEKKYATMEQNPIFACENGGIDNIISPQNTRQYLVSVLQMVVNKENVFPLKKHGNMPL